VLVLHRHWPYKELAHNIVEASGLPVDRGNSVRLQALAERVPVVTKDVDSGPLHLACGMCPDKDSSATAVFSTLISGFSAVFDGYGSLCFSG
jgi:hypothetical protein